MGDQLLDQPPSPNDDSDDEDERLFWFKYVEDIMLTEHQRQVDLRDNVSEDDLGMNKKQRSQASKKSDSSKRNFFVRDIISGNILMVKLHTNVERSYKEWFINCKLRQYNVPHVVPAIAWCKGRQTPKALECAFLILPFKRSISLAQLSSSEETLTDLQWLQGFQQIIEVFVVTDPETVGTNHLKLRHKDLNEGQILYEPTTNNWYLIDFGLSEITYFGSPLPETKESVEMKAEITIRASSSFSNSSLEFDTLIPMFVKQLQSETLKLHLFSIKTRDRNSWLNTVNTQIQLLSKPV